MRTLTEADVVQAFREEHARRLAELAKDVDVVFGTKDGGQRNVLSSDLKLRHKKTGLLYTVDSVGTKDTIMRTPEGKKFLVHNGELEQEYELA
jgi:hypothetical protein